MLYKMIAAALLVSSGEALKLDGMGMGMSRRAAVAKAASLALPLAAMPAFALNRAEDAEIYKRADEGKLNAIRAIERAKDGNLADGTSATVSPRPHRLPAATRSLRSHASGCLRSHPRAYHIS